MKFAFAFVALALSVVVFQNCGLPFRASLNNDDLASFGEPSSYVRSADLGWSAKGSDLAVDSNTKVSRWMDVTGKKIPLYPPLRTAGAGTDPNYTGSLVTVSGQPYIALGAEQVLTPSANDLSAFLSDRYSFLFVIRDLTVSSTQPIRLIHMTPADGSNTGELDLDAEMTGSSVQLHLYHWFGANNSQRTIVLDPSVASGVLAIGLRFDNDGSNVQIAVNGKLAANAAVTTGSPPYLGFVTRTFVIHTPTGVFGSSGSFSLGELGLYLQSLSDNDLAQGTYSLYNRWSLVQNTATPTPAPTATPSASATGAQLYTQYCASCHNALASSTKRNTTLTALNNAIVQQSTMNNLSSLSQSDLAKIVDALK